MLASPQEIQCALREKFHFPTDILAGVVSTNGKEGISSRMMRVYDIDEKGCPILLTHTGTKKWEEIKNSPSVSLCFVSEDKLFQVLLRGSANLVASREEASPYWETIRPDVQDYYLKGATTDHAIPDTLGVIKIEPTFWETLELVIPYSESVRFQFLPSPSGWVKKQVPI